LSPHWALATRGTATTLLLSLPAAGVWAFYRGVLEAGAFLYGVGVGLLVFVAIAVTVSLLTVRPSGVRILVGAGIYLGRLVFATAAIGGVAIWGYLPVVPMVLGFAGVYVVENVVLLWGAWKAGGHAVPRRPGAERRFEV
jgi:hypothetical protein